MRNLLSGALTVVVTLSLIGCSSSKKAADDAVGRELQEYIDNIDAYEDFDVTSYVDPPPVVTANVVHDVPPELMTGTVESGARKLVTIQGFRIQVHSSLDKEGAVAAEERAKAWWRTVTPEEKPSSLNRTELPVYLKYVQPYYRVRVGNFATRDDAEIALQLVLQRFPRAFIAVDRVTVLQ